LIENSLRAQKKDSDMRTVFKQLEMASKLKESSNLHEMNKNALKEMFERFHKKKIIEKMILK
jgi:ribosomal protein S20